MEYRTTSNWRHIFASPEVDYCLGRKWFPKYFEMIDVTLNDLFPNKTIGCPLAPSKLYAKDILQYMGPEKDYLEPNGTISNGPKRNALGFDLPNGKYRYTVHVFDKNLDPHGCFIQWQAEVRDRLNENNF
jgi:hypothetical protein